MAEHADPLFPVLWSERSGSSRVDYPRIVRAVSSAQLVAAVYALCLYYSGPVVFSTRADSASPWRPLSLSRPRAGVPLTVGACRVAVAARTAAETSGEAPAHVEVLADTGATSLVFAFARVSSGGWSLAASADALPADPNALQRVCGHLAAFAEAVDEAEIGTVRYLTEAETRAVVDLNATSQPPPTHDCLHTLFEAAADQMADHPAVIYGDAVLTYRELDEKANALALRLVAHGAGAGCRVGIIATRSARFVVAVLASWKIGAAYVPLDPLLPRQRRETLFRLGAVDLLVAEAEHAAQASELTSSWIELVSMSRLTGVGREELPAVTVTGKHLAYVIFTSGSSGEPKGVLLDHAGRASMIEDLNRRIAVDPEDRMLVVASPSFDMSVYDIFGMLAAGATVVLPRAGQEYDVDHWADLALRHRVSLWHSVPSTAELLLNMWGERPAESMRVMLLDGDWIPVGLPHRLQRLFPQARVFSLGGATEVSVVSVHYEVKQSDPAWRSVPYGRPLGNQTAYIVDRFGGLAAIDQPGELLLGGHGVSWGYDRRPGLTAERFVPDPFGSRPGARLYRTGDLARLRPDGAIELLGRIDQQVKIRGVRVELGEVQLCLLQHDGVADAVVVPKRAADGIVHSLAAYIIAAPGTDSAVEGDLVPSVRRHAEARLPAPVVPGLIYLVDEFPLNQNGKVDRRALEGSREAPPLSLSIGPGSADEAKRAAEIAEIWRAVLGLDSLPALSEPFLDLGGTSLGAMQVAGRLNRRFAIEVTVSDLLDASTVAEVAELVSARLASSQGPRPQTRPLLRRRPR